MIASNTIIGGRYRVVRPLGGGGMKLVYLAEDQRLGSRYCALAEMIDSFTSTETQQQAIAAFQREADMLAQLSNEHIPRVIDRFSEANRHYLVMEFIDGETFEDELKQSDGKLAAEYVIDVAIQILETLEYLHSLTPPVIYRDLKPSNVMITAAGRAKLVDFGIARHFAPLSNATMIGTQGYAPPEQYRGKVETRSDLYALGATMHQALSGRDPAAEPPFSFPPLRKLVPEINGALAATVDSALAYDVTSRIASAGEFKRRLLEMRDRARDPSASSQPATVTAVPQLQLPLGPKMTDQATVTTPPSPSASNAPTVVITDPTIRCRNCVAIVPADSHFCSYCGATIRGTPGAAISANDATVILSPQQAEPANWPARRPSRRRGLRHPAMIIVLLFLLAFAVMWLMVNASSNGLAPRDYGESPGFAPARDARFSPILHVRLAMLRQALDDSGYHAVQFRLEGGTLVLWGLIPTEDDRATVQMMCANIAGVASIRDNLRAADGDPADGS